VTVRWARRAQTQFYAYIDYLSEHSPRFVDTAIALVEHEIQRVEARPMIAAELTQWPGVRRWPIPRLKKLIYFSSENGDVRIVAFLDMRAKPPVRLG
jgi:plasmid stabilization system protein ParE